MAVQVLPGFVPRAAVGCLARRVLESTGHADRRAEVEDRVTIDADHVGRGYGFATEAGEHATRVASAHGLVLEQTYTAKAFEKALELLVDSAPRLPGGRCGFSTGTPFPLRHSMTCSRQHPVQSCCRSRS
jgi:hypothetical protein